MIGKKKLVCVTYMMYYPEDSIQRKNEVKLEKGDLCSKCQGLKICDIRKTHMATRITLHMALKIIHPTNYLVYNKKHSLWPWQCSTYQLLTIK